MIVKRVGVLSCARIAAAVYAVFGLIWGVGLLIAALLGFDIGADVPSETAKWVRPMFGENLPNLESFLFDFTGDLYDEHLSVALIDYLRPEATFDSVEALIEQMDAD